MSDFKETMDECHPVLLASTLYADYLNSMPMSLHIKKLLGKTDVKIAPYCYFFPDKMDYEKPKGQSFHDDLFTENYKVPLINLQSEDDIIKHLVPSYKKHLPKNAKAICGMIGVPISPDDDDEEESEQDHYVSYVFKDDVLYYFDSAIDKTYEDTETFHILKNTFNPTTIETNTKTFEEAGGVSEDPFNYVAQNIFCHSWSLWFLYQFIVNNKTMKDIDKFAGKGTAKNKNNLILIKTFIYTLLIPKLGLDKLLSLGLFDYFRYIIINNDKFKILEIIKSH